ncbi:unnamed protein product [Citrullus colocynthis]|uniref:Uncharacterized protein n=1 Tax=Citrullus colocynthis TaxID=252529 RepID=A0ABP0YXJ3_9ROSI
MNPSEFQAQPFSPIPSYSQNSPTSSNVLRLQNSSGTSTSINDQPTLSSHKTDDSNLTGQHSVHQFSMVLFQKISLVIILNNEPLNKIPPPLKAQINLRFLLIQCRLVPKVGYLSKKFGISYLKPMLHHLPEKDQGY